MKPTIDEMKAELLAAGWTALKPWLWRAPGGGLHYGPLGAWRVMIGQWTGSAALATMPSPSRRAQ
jgi:hypothetical protein